MSYRLECFWPSYRGVFTVVHRLYRAGLTARFPRPGWSGGTGGSSCNKPASRSGPSQVCPHAQAPHPTTGGAAFARGVIGCEAFGDDLAGAQAGIADREEERRSIHVSMYQWPPLRRPSGRRQAETMRANALSSSCMSAVCRYAAKSPPSSRQ